MGFGGGGRSDKALKEQQRIAAEQERKLEEERKRLESEARKKEEDEKKRSLAEGYMMNRRSGQRRTILTSPLGLSGLGSEKL